MAGPPRPLRLLLYAMYDPAEARNAPRVRIRMLTAALSGQADVTLLAGSRLARLAAGVRLLLGGGLARSDAVYVETATASAMPWDLALLAAARIAGRPVGVYFRDAYPRFRDLYPTRGWRARLSDTGWRLSVAILRRVASVSFVPSAGLGAVLALGDPVPLPPGTDPATPDLGAGSEPVVAYVGALTPQVGFDRLLEAMLLVRAELPEARLLAIGPGAPRAATPDWVEVRAAARDELAPLLAPVAVCVLPLPVNRYTELAWPLKLGDYLAFGKPIVATSTAQVHQVLAGPDAGLLVADSPGAIAAGLLTVLRDPALAGELAARARSLALEPSMTWQHRAATIVTTLSGLRRHR